jgi:hypothetical protein
VPTFETSQRFSRDLRALGAEARNRFRAKVRDEFVVDLASGQGFRAGLRVKRVLGTRGVWEMTWAPDGRATFSYGDERRPGEPHVVWRRVGSHNIFQAP